MGGRLLVTGAGSGASNNLIRSLRTGDPSLIIVGCDDDRFALKNSSADRNYLVPSASAADYAAGVRRVIAIERIELLVPNSDPDVSVLSRFRRRFPCRLFLPRRAVIDLCQDKYRLISFLRSRRLPVPATYPVTSPDTLDGIFRRLNHPARAWCRIRTGSGSLGAVPVTTPRQARHWIRCWGQLRRIPARSFILSEYLPGRDFGCQSLWRDGKLILAKTCERLSYLAAGNQLSGVSSVAALAKTVFEPRVAEACADAIRALDPKVSGAFSVDLKENADGVPCITEINAGRLSSGTNLFDLTGKHNMALTYVRLGLGEAVDLGDPYDAAEDYYMLRELDTLPAVIHADDLFERIHEV